MRKSFGIFFVASLLAAAPSMAGNLTLENGKTTWVSTQCPMPAAPGSITGAKPDTDGDDMNGLVGQHNAWVDSMQNYMNCLSSEAERDQTLVDQTISAAAQRQIAQAQGEVDTSMPSRHK